MADQTEQEQKRPWLLDAWDAYEMAVHGKTGNTYESQLAARITAAFQQIHDAARAADAEQIARLSAQMEELKRDVAFKDSLIWTSRESELYKATVAAEKDAKAARAERDAAQQQIATLTAYKAAFEELYATVQGECPSLLDPCRGGSDVLWNLCAAALQSTRPQEQP